MFFVVVVVAGSDIVRCLLLIKLGLIVRDGIVQRIEQEGGGGGVYSRIYQ